MFISIFVNDVIIFTQPFHCLNPDAPYYSRGHQWALNYVGLPFPFKFIPSKYDLLTTPIERMLTQVVHYCVIDNIFRLNKNIKLDRQDIYERSKKLLMPPNHQLQMKTGNSYQGVSSTFFYLRKYPSESSIFCHINAICYQINTNEQIVFASV